ncbi:MAG: AAA family ATPase, partial [Anaerolineae bacterium]|nr:AAA family ATPase [Anaerolineae bacterium]
MSSPITSALMTTACTKSALTEPPPGTPWLILVTGAPATGKTALSVPLAARLQVPLLTKDAIKERLFDTLGWSDREWSKRLGSASFALLYDWLALHLRVGAPLVVEANFKPQFDTPKFAALRECCPFTLLQIVLVAAPEALQARFAARSAAGERHPGHVDTTFEGEFAAQLQAELYGPLELDSTVVV